MKRYRERSLKKNVCCNIHHTMDTRIGNGCHGCVCRRAKSLLPLASPEFGHHDTVLTTKKNYETPNTRHHPFSTKFRVPTFETLCVGPESRKSSENGGHSGPSTVRVHRIACKSGRNFREVRKPSRLRRYLAITSEETRQRRAAEQPEVDVKHLQGQTNRRALQILLVLVLGWDKSGKEGPHSTHTYIGTTRSKRMLTHRPRTRKYHHTHATHTSHTRPTLSPCFRHVYVFRVQVVCVFRV